MSDYETIIYWFNSFDAGTAWTNNPGGMANNTTGDYASSDLDLEGELLNGNTATADAIGEISAVELRAFGYGDGGDFIEYTPTFLIGGAGTPITWIPPNGIGAAAYDAWRDITNDAVAPSPWEWTDVNGLTCIITANADAKMNPIFVSTVEIRVTFRKPVQPGYSIQPFHY